MTPLDLIDEITAGTTLDFTTAVPDYPANSGWTLTYYLRGPSSVNLTAITAADGQSYEVQATAATTGAWLPGVYSWEARVSNSNGVIYTVASGRLTVLQDLTQQAAGFDGRTQAETALAAVEAEILARATGGATIEYSIGNRSLKKEPISALLALRSQLKNQIATQRRADTIANGLGDPTKMFARFR